MDDKAHIRDWLQMTPEDLAAGRVTGKTLCGLDDPEHKKLTFAAYEAVASASVKNYCEKCRKQWLAEYQGSENRNARRRFREVISSLYNNSRLTPKTNKRLLITKP